uniref:Myosin_tail_1 domain-containing protein n=1 Tax=Angiostrongylus cantonensis TaxID=6313 RepID=A0A0K0D8R9_ANGCA
LGKAKIELENVCAASREMEKRQRKFENQLAEERENVQKATREQDAHVQKLRSSEATILSLRNELKQLNETIDEKERVRRMLQLEQDESVAIEDLEDKLRLFEDARIRLEANIEALCAENDITLMAKNLEAEHKCKSHMTQLQEVGQDDQNEGEEFPLQLMRKKM